MTVLQSTSTVVYRNLCSTIHFTFHHLIHCGYFMSGHGCELVVVYGAPDNMNQLHQVQHIHLIAVFINFRWCMCLLT